MLAQIIRQDRSGSPVWGISMEIELKQLEAFVVLAREGSFTKAAEFLDIRQPTLSARIQRLEELLNGELVDRRTRPINLTSFGRVFLEHAERAVAIVEMAAELAKDQQPESVGQIKLACPFSVATYLMPEVVDNFSQVYPRAELLIETGNSDYVVSQLSDGLVNVGIAAAFPKYLTQVQMLDRLHDEMAVAVAAEHPFIGQTQPDIIDILSFRIVLIHWGAAFHTYIESLRLLSPNPGPLIRMPLASALPMAHQADTVTFMPRRLITPSGLVEIAVRNFAFSWDIALMTRPGRSLTYLEQEFFRIVTSVWQRSQPAR